MKIVLALVALASLAVTSADSAEASRSEIVIRDHAFGPGQISVRVGTVVVFKNADNEAHSAVAADGRFNSQAINPGASYAVTMDRPGDLRYFCSVHPFMEGHIVVTR